MRQKTKYVFTYRERNGILAVSEKRNGNGGNGMAKALHQQVSDYIRTRILQGEYPVGSQIPTENELAEILHVSRPTIRQALDGLAHEGYLERVKGRGTFVTQPKVLHESTSFITGYRAESEKNNRVMHTRVLELHVERAKEHVCEALKLPANARVIKLVRVRYLEGYHDNAPVVYTTVYVPYRLFPDMQELDFGDASFYDALSERNLSVWHASRKLEVVPVPKEIAVELKTSPFEPAIFVTSVGETKEKIPVEYANSYYPAGISSFQVEIYR